MIFGRFIVVGVVATIVHVAVLVALVEWAGVSAVLASIPAFAIAMLASYSANRGWTFRRPGNHDVQLPRYAAVAILGLLLNVWAMTMAVNILGLPYWVGLVAVVAIASCASFALNSRWTFST